MVQFSTCRYKLIELMGYVAMGAVPALVILSMVSLHHIDESFSESATPLPPCRLPSTTVTI